MLGIKQKIILEKAVSRYEAGMHNYCKEHHILIQEWVKRYRVAMERVLRTQGKR